MEVSHSGTHSIREPLEHPHISLLPRLWLAREETICFEEEEPSTKGERTHAKKNGIQSSSSPQFDSQPRDENTPTSTRRQIAGILLLWLSSGTRPWSLRPRQTRRARRSGVRSGWGRSSRRSSCRSWRATSRGSSTSWDTRGRSWRRPSAWRRCRWADKTFFVREF